MPSKPSVATASQSPVVKPDVLAAKVQWAIDKARNDSQLLDGRNYRSRTWTMCDKALAQLVTRLQAAEDALAQISRWPAAGQAQTLARRTLLLQTTAQQSSPNASGSCSPLVGQAAQEEGS